MRTRLAFLSDYINHVYGQEYETALVFEDTKSANEHIKYLDEIIREHPELSDKERVFLLNELKEKFYGL